MLAPGALLSVLKQAIPTLDAVSYDNEDLYDVSSSVALGQRLAGLGFKITLCPYTNVGYWKSVKTQLGARVTGSTCRSTTAAGNDVASWNSQMGMTVMPGLDTKTPSGGNAPAQVNTRMAAWKAPAGITGSFIWYYDAILNHPANGSAADYAAAVNTALGTASTGSPRAWRSGGRHSRRRVSRWNTGRVRKRRSRARRWALRSPRPAPVSHKEPDGDEAI